MHRDAQQDWATSRHSADTPSYIEKVGTGEMYAGLHPQTYMPCEITHHWKRWRTALITHAEASKCLHMHYIHHHPSSSIISIISIMQLNTESSVLKPYKII